MKTSYNDFFNTTFGAAKDYIANPISAVIKDKVEEFQKYVGIPETIYDYSADNFPGDVGSDQTGHYVRITAFTGGTTFSGSVTDSLGFQPPNTPQYTANIFIPGAAPGESMPLIYESKHNFTDVRLTNIFNDSMLGVAAGLLAKRSINPMVQVLYRSTDLRQFDFAFLMIPRNEKESQSIERICKNIRAFAAPEFNRAVVIAPAEFQITFHNKGDKENPHLPKLERCVITRVNVNYAPSSTYSTFRNGYPTATLLTFSATEVRLIDRSKIKQTQGY